MGGGTKACSDGGGAELEQEDQESLQRETGACEGSVAAGKEPAPWQCVWSHSSGPCANTRLCHWLNRKGNPKLALM